MRRLAPKRGIGMTPRVAVLVIGDGRDDLRQATLDSFGACSRNANVTTVVEVDDRRHKLGFCGAIQEGWARLRAVHGSHPFDYVFHLEEDWRFLRDFDVSLMADLLDLDERLAQVALRRGPEPGEVASIDAWPVDYEDCTMREWSAGGLVETPWLRHSLFFTTNPSLYRASLIERGWPSAPRCEETFGEALKADGLHFGYWGARSDAPWIEHTGTKRTGRGY